MREMNGIVNEMGDPPMTYEPYDASQIALNVDKLQAPSHTHTHSNRHTHSIAFVWWSCARLPQHMVWNSISLTNYDLQQSTFNNAQRFHNKHDDASPKTIYERSNEKKKYARPRTHTHTALIIRFSILSTGLTSGSVSNYRSSSQLVIEWLNTFRFLSHS